MGAMGEFDLQLGHLALGLYVLLLATAAVTDIWQFKIPNAVSIALVVLFFPTALLLPLEVDWLSHIGAALVMFVAGVVAFALRWMGGGDAKLIAAVSLWAGFQHLLQFLFYFALAGGALALFLLVLRQVVSLLPVARPALAAGSLPRLLVKGEHIPYGVAISCGAVILGFGLPILGLSG